MTVDQKDSTKSSFQAPSPAANLDTESSPSSIELPSKAALSRHNSNDCAVPSTTANSVLFSKSLFEGSPAYKQRRKKSSRDKKQRQQRAGTATSNYDSGDEESDSGSDGMHISDYPFASTNEAPKFHTAAFNLSGPGIIDENSEAEQLLNLSASNALRASAIPPPAQSNFVLPLVEPEAVHATQKPISWPWNSSNKSPEETVYRASTYTPASSSIRTDIAAQVPNSTGNNAGTGLNSLPTKGFSCPLLSCGRLFKRLEHLKRHVRTHTQERPYECPRCGKRFSRSDNLTQHYKTHEKADRGERMKTEASETTEDDMATFLEAEVDAMAVRESRSLLGTPDGTANYRYAEHGDAGNAVAGRKQFSVNCWGRADDCRPDAFCSGTIARCSFPAHSNRLRRTAFCLE